MNKPEFAEPANEADFVEPDQGAADAATDPVTPAPAALATPPILSAPPAALPVEDERAF